MKQVEKPARVTVALLTHIPATEGYHAASLDVLKVCLDSLWNHTRPPFDLLVLDNASGAETIAYLQEQFQKGRIHYLLLSGWNLGVGGAWDVILPACPGEILAYSDSDVYFHPGWLEKGMELLEGFPNVGMVTCRPMRTSPELSTATVAWARSDSQARLTSGAWIPWETFREHDVGLGQPEQEVRARFDSTQDLRVEYRGLAALIGATHWQFLAYKNALRRVLPLELSQPMGEAVRRLDQRLNDAGFLRLMTLEPLVRHLGNVIPADLAVEPSGPAPNAAPGGSGLGRRILHWAPVRRLLLAVHSRIFRWYFGPRRERT
jgi:glycosyltransferase involved in cell wall biosynthesis